MVATIAPSPSVPSVPSVPSAPRARSGEPLARALHRLADKGRAEGVRVTLALTGHDSTYLASSASVPGLLYCVVIDPRSKSYGCDCQGWAKHRRCKHFALAIEAAGWLPEPPDDPGAGGASAPHSGIHPPRAATLAVAAGVAERAAAAMGRLAERQAATERAIADERPAYDVAGLTDTDRFDGLSPLGHWRVAARYGRAANNGLAAASCQRVADGLTADWLAEIHRRTAADRAREED